MKLSVLSSAATSQFCSGPLNIPVADNAVNGAASSVTVSGLPAGCQPADISVVINMQHSRIGDMVFILKAPNGQIISLDYRLSTTGGNGATTGFSNTVISSTGIPVLSSGSNPYTGSFKADAVTVGSGGFGPAGPTGMLPTTSAWSNLLTLLNGNWTLGCYDGATGETGILNNWCLRFSLTCPNATGATPAIWSPATGLYMEPACVIPYIPGTAIDSVWAKPGLQGTYTYQVTHQSLPSPPIIFSNTAPVTIPVGGTATPYSSDITVAGVPLSGVTVKSVVLHNISHTLSDDIDIVLQSPTGQTVILMSDVGGPNPVNASYTFLDSGYSMVGTSYLTGRYRPTNLGSPDNFPAPGPGSITQFIPTLSMFTGNFNGTWKLFVVDDDGTAGQGVVSGGFTINFDTTSAVCTSPATSVTVVVGALPVISLQPADQTVCQGNNAFFAAAATGTGLTYQWQVTTNGGITFTNLINSGTFSGVNTGTLTITAPPVSMSGQRFRVVINGGGTGCAAATSNTALLTVNALPSVSFYPHPYSLLLPGLTTTLQSVVSPAAASYTWLHDGIAVPGGIADTLLVDFNNIGLYQLRVTDINGCTNISDTMSIRDSALGKMFIYPNPSGGRFQVRLYSSPGSSQPRMLSIYNSMGNKVMVLNYDQTRPYQQVLVDIRKNGKGIYWVEVADKNGKRISLSRILIQ